LSDNLIQQFKNHAKTHLKIDYANKKSVKEGNKAVNKMFDIAQKIFSKGQMDEFIELLTVKDNKIDLWTAHILLERLNAQGNTAQNALAVIKGYASLDTPDSFGEKLWLEHWLIKNR